MVTKAEVVAVMTSYMVAIVSMTLLATLKMTLALVRRLEVSKTWHDMVW